MPHIILSDDQVRLLAKTYPVQVLDAQGNVVGHIEPVGFSPEEIAAAKRDAAAAGLWYTGDEVRSRLQLLEETLVREGKLDKERVRDLLNEARSQSGP